MKKTVIYYGGVTLFVAWCFFLLILNRNIIPGIYILTASSYSMKPAILPDNRLLVLQQKSYKEGDIITYRIYEKGKPVLITHRINGISGNAYITKGDLNEGIDRNIVSPAQIVGKVLYIFPNGMDSLLPFICITGAIIIGYELKKIFFGP